MDQNRQFTEHEVDTIASALYDGGWRAEDRDWMIEEYDFTEELADLICNTLRDFAAWEAAEWLQDIEEDI